MLTACSGGSSDRNKNSANNASETGRVAFSASWPSNPMTSSDPKQSPSGNVCIDYNVDTITCNVYDASGSVVGTKSWPCSEHGGTISKIPAGSGMWLMLEGIASKTVLLRGQSGTFTVLPNAVTSVAQVSMNQIANDTEPPQVNIATPPDAAVDVPLNSAITAEFTEDVDFLSVLTGFAVSTGATEVSGSIFYDPSTLTVTFTPEANLASSTKYTATIKSGITDLAGNQMTSDYIWEFTSVSTDTPTVGVPQAIQVTESTARLTVGVNPNGVGTTVYFEYGTDLTYGSTTSQQDAGSAKDPVPVFADLNSLDQGVAYHFRGVATNTAGTSYGPDGTFTTDAVWTKVYDFADESLAQATMMEQTSDGGYIIAGRTDVTCGNDCNEVWILKLNANGGIEWEKAYDLNLPTAIQQTADKGYIVVGYTRTPGAGDDDIWILKLGETGNREWSRSLSGTSNERPSAIRTTPDGGFIISGNTETYGAGLLDMWIVKTAPNGVVEWQKSYGGSDWDESRSIQLTPDGGYIVIGSTGSFGAGDFDVWILKLQADGSIAWQKTYGGPDREHGYSVQPTTDGGFIVISSTDSFGAGSGDIWLLKIDAGGNVSWQKTYGGTLSDFAKSVTQTTDGGYFVVGFSHSFSTGHGDDIWALKLDANGTLEWQKTYEGMTDDYGLTGYPTPDGGYMVSANTTSFGAHYSDFWLLKIGHSGSTVCGLGMDSSGQVFTPNVTGAATEVAATDTLSTAYSFMANSEDTTATVGTHCP